MYFFSRKKRARFSFAFLIFVFFSFLFISCAPVQETYYAISSDAADQILQNHCRETTPAGPLGTAIFQAYEDVTIEITSKITAYGWHARAILRIPDGTRVVFRDNSFKARDLSSKKLYTNHVSKVYFYEDEKMTSKHKWEREIFSSLEGKTTTIGNSIFGKSERKKRYFVDIIFGIFDAKSIQFFFPEIEINGRAFNLPVILFTRESGWFVYPLNC